MLERDAGEQLLLLAAVRPFSSEDWPAVEAIYREGIVSGDATFEAEPPSWEDFDAGRLADLRLAAVDESGTVLAWAAASPGRQAPAQASAARNARRSAAWWVIVGRSRPPASLAGGRIMTDPPPAASPLRLRRPPRHDG